MTTFGRIRTGWLLGAASAAALMIAAPAQAQSLDARTQLNIPAESLADALVDFARQTKVQVVTASADLGQARTRGVSGVLTPRDALGRLLSGTSLRWREVGQGSVVVEAAPQGDEATSVEELVVTANKRAERLHDVAASVTALAGPSLVEKGIVRFDDYAAKVPGLVVDNTTAAGGLTQISIRGVTAGGGGGPTVGFYIDDAPFGSSTLLGRGTILSPDLDPSDLQRIEVLRGPQGTLYGAGAMGGLIKFVTTDPDPSHMSGRLEADVSAVDDGGTGYGLRGAVNLPVSEAVALRVSAYDREDPGFFDNTLLGQRDVNKAQVYGGRVALGFRFNENWNLTLSALTQQLRQDGVPLQDYDAITGARLGGDLEQSRAFGTGRTDASYDMFNIRLRGDLGWAELVSATSYSRVTSDLFTDATPLYGPLVTAFFGIPNPGAAIDTHSGLDKFTQELRLASPAERRLAWQVGAFYTHEHSFSRQSVPVFDPLTGGPTTPPLPDFVDVALPTVFEEIALFGDATWKLNERFDITGGLRWSHNNQEGTQTLGGLAVGPTSTLPMKSSDDSVTWMLTPRLHLNDQVMVYGRVATGYRPGGPNAAVPGVPASYGPDKVVNYELGLKGDLLDRRLSLELAAFYIDWKDVQLTLISPLGISFIDNAGKASSKGVEGSMSWRPVQGLQVDANLAYTDATLGEDLPAPGVGLKGDDLPSIPHWAGQVSADYEFPLSNAWSGVVGASWRHVGERMSDFSRSPVIPRYVLPAYDVADLRVGVKHDRAVLMLYAKNVGDERGQLSAFNAGPLQEVAIIQPRTFGLSLSTEF